LERLLGGNMKGFTLTEVLIAAMLLSLGITGIVTLQSQYVEKDRAFYERQIALHLAHQKLTDLQQFQSLLDDTVAAYGDIGDDAGGFMDAGENIQTMSSDGEEVEYSLHWQVENQYFVDADKDGVADTWRLEGDEKLPTVLPSVADKKDVRISVSWTDQEANLQTIQLHGAVSPLPRARSFQVTHRLGELALVPRVAADTPVDAMVHLVSEAQKRYSQDPEITVFSSEQRAVTWRTFSYSSDDINDYVQTQEDFLTVNCACKLAGSELGYSPAIPVVENDTLVDKIGELRLKTVGELAYTDQAEECNVCCRDHHDDASMVKNEQYFRLDDGLPHAHYQRQADGTYVLAHNLGDPYDEVCRFKRIDGKYHIYTDWQLVSLQAFDMDTLSDPEFVDDYTAYVAKVIAAQVGLEELPSPMDLPPVAIDKLGRQLIARGLYIDKMQSAHLEYIAKKWAHGESDWANTIPFYDVNLTLLADWNAIDNKVAGVSQDKLQDVAAHTDTYYSIVSRGFVSANGPGSTNIQVGVYPFNAGAVAVEAVSSLEYSNKVTDNSLSVVVSGP
jgi:type II secretory pathway pseudopilin PulG